LLQGGLVVGREQFQVFLLGLAEGVQLSDEGVFGVKFAAQLLQFGLVLGDNFLEVLVLLVDG
jgi:hypothetical protein